MSLAQGAFAAYTIFTGLLTSTIMSHKPVYQTLVQPLVGRPKLAHIASIVAEYSNLILLSKILIAYEVVGTSFFDGFWMTLVYRLDLAIMLTLWGQFLQSIFSRHPIYEATKFMRNSSSTTPPSVWSFSFWFRFANPFWSSRSLLVHENSMSN